MTVTKIEPAAWSGHQGRIIRQFDDDTLFAVTVELDSGSYTAYFWVSDDEGATWSAHPALTSIAADSYAIVTATPVGPDDDVAVAYKVFGGKVRFRVFTADTMSAPYECDTNARRMLLLRDDNLLIGRAGSDRRQFVDAGSASANSTATSFFDVTAANSQLGIGTADWQHDGTGRIAAVSDPSNYAHIAQSNSARIFRRTFSSSTVSSYTVHGEDIACCDGENVWTYGGETDMRKVPYSMLSNTEVTYPTGGGDTAGAFCHHEGKILALVLNDDDGDVYRLDTDSASWDTDSRNDEIVETHTDFDDTTTWDAERYPQREALHLIRTDGTNAAYYRVVFNSAPDKPVVTVPAMRAESADLDVEWTFDDADGHDQLDYVLRRRVGSGAWQYWNASSDTWGTTVVRNTYADQSVSLTASEWRSGTDDHWFGVQTRDDPLALESEWSDDVKIAVVDDPEVTIVSMNDDAVTDSATVKQLVNTIGWESTSQQRYRIQTFAADRNDATIPGNERTDSGWIDSLMGTSAPVTFSADNETGFVTVTVDGYGGPETSDTISYTVDLPDPPGTTTITVTTAGTPMNRITVTGAWPADPEVVAVTLHRRIVGDTGLGIVVADPPVVSDAAEFDDYRVMSGTDYEYRWDMTTDEDAFRLDTAWTS